MFQPKTETQDLLLLLLKTVKRLLNKLIENQKKHWKLKLPNPEKLIFKRPISVGGSKTIGLTNLELCHSFFNGTEAKNKFEKGTGPPDDEVPYTELKDNVAEVLGLLDISMENLKHKKYGLNLIKTYRELSIEKSQTDGYYNLLIVFTQSSFRDFESYLRFSSPLDENDFQLLLKQYNSQLIQYEISPSPYSNEDIPEVFSKGFKIDLEIRGKMRPNGGYDRLNSINIDYNDIN